MRENDVRALIVQLFREKSDAAYSVSEIARILCLRGKTRKKLRGWLTRLCAEQVLETTDQRFRRFQGRIDNENPCHSRRRRGRLYARTYEKRDGRTERGQRIRRSGHGGRSDFLVGRLEADNTGFRVVPLSSACRISCRISSPGEAKPGDCVVVRTHAHGETSGAHHVLPIADGRIEEILGAEGNVETETRAAIWQYALPEHFPPDVLAEAERAESVAHSPGARFDARDRFVITIDPEQARDFDDALSLEIDANGHRILGVHIADVSHFVPRGSALDREARRRGNSVYFPHRALPMLPPRLANEWCSLQPDQDRLAVSVFLTVDENGRILRRAFCRSLIRSRVRLTYEEVRRFLARPPAAARATDDSPSVQAFSLPSHREPSTGVLLNQLHTLAQQLRRRRLDQGALDLDVPEVTVLLNHKGEPVGVRPVESDPAHHIVEECMIAANEAVAGELIRCGVTIISRLHEPPSEKRMVALRTTAAALGCAAGDLTQPRALSNFLQNLGDHPLARYMRMLTLRSLPRAIYSANAQGHFGLATRHYTHFTSPIRRYADLVVHRQLLACLPAAPVRPVSLHGGAQTYDVDDLEAIAQHCSYTERAAEEAEAQVVERLKFCYLTRRLAAGALDDYTAIVARVLRMGVAVDLPDLDVMGWIPAAAFFVVQGRYRVDRTRRRAFAGRSVLKPGGRLRVIPTRVDSGVHRVELAPVVDNLTI